MSAKREVVADVRGVPETEVKCEACAYHEHIGNFGLVQCLNWGELVNAASFCTFWERGGYDGTD